MRDQIDAATAYYQPSGQVARGAAAVAVAGGLGVLPAALLYAWVTMRAPAWINAVALLFFGLWIAVVVDVVALRAKVRSSAWIARYAVLLALAAWYAQWSVWMALAMHRQQAGTLLSSAALLALHPDALATGAVQLVAHNAWGLGAMPMVAVWLLEAYVLVQMAPGLGRDRVAHPFCERAGTWAERIAVRRKFACIAQPGAVADLLERAPQQLVPVLSAWAPPAPHYAELTLYRTQDAAYVSIRNVWTRAGSKGAALQHVLVALRLPGADVDALIEKLVARADTRPAAGADEAAPGEPELASAQALFQAARSADALARALPHARAPRRALRVEANRLCASACMRLARWREAGAYWEAVSDDEPTVRNALQQAGSAVMGGDLDGGVAHFQHARALNAATRELPPLALLTTFVSALDMAGRPGTAMRWLDEIRECYCACRVTDPTVLFAQRMPSFSEFLERSAPVVVAALGRERGLRWFAAMLGRLDEAGNVELGQWLDEQARSLAG